MNKANLLLSTAVGLAFVVAGPTVQAGGKKHPTGAKGHASLNFAKAPFKSHKGPQQRANSKLKEKFMVETWGVTTVSLFGGLVAQDIPTSVNCKKTCTIVTYGSSEFLSYYSYNQVGICPLVDGYFTNGSCYFSGTVNPNDLYAVRTNQTNLTVGSGTHTVQTYVYTVAPAYMGHYQNDYHVYQ